MAGVKSKPEIPAAAARKIAESYGCSQVITALSMETGIARNQVERSLYKAIRAGVPEEDVASFMSVAAKAAIAVGIDLETVVGAIIRLGEDPWSA